MHILIIPTMYPNGYNKVSNIFFRDQAEALAAAGHKVGVIAICPVTIQSVISSRKLEFGLKVFNANGVLTFIYQILVPPLSSKLQQWLRKYLIQSLWQEYKKIQGTPDILHVHTYKAAVSAIEILKLSKIPYVITEHSTIFASGLVNTYSESIAKIAYEKSEANIAVSNEFCKLLNNRYHQNFEYIPNVVNTVFFKPSVQKQDNKIIRILNIAYLDKKKQQDLLIRSFANIVQIHPTASLVIGGRGPEEANLRKLVHELNIESNVEFLGHLNRQEVLNEMQTCSLFVLSSKVETFGVVLIEAMACGKPIVATKSGGPETILIHDYLGELVDDTKDDLTRGMLKVISMQAYYEPDKIRKYVELEFSQKAVTDKLKALYTRVIKGMSHS